MITMKTLDYIEMEEVCEEFHTNLSYYAFIREAGNDSFVYLSAADDRLEEIEDDIADCTGYDEDEYAQRLMNDKTLMEWVRSFGKTGIWVYVSW